MYIKPHQTTSISGNYIPVVKKGKKNPDFWDLLTC